MRELITTELVRRLQKSHPSTERDIWDLRQPRLVLRARPNGKHSYRVALGRGRSYTLGSTELIVSPAIARQQAHKILGEYANGRDPRVTKRAQRQYTLRDYIEQIYKVWLTEHRRSGAKIIAQMRAVFVPALGDLKIDALSAWHVEKWRSARLKAGITPATTNRDIGALRAMLNRAIEWGHLSVQPLAKVKALPEDRIGRLRYLSAEEEKRLRTALAARDTKRRAERESANVWRRERSYGEWSAYGTYTDHLTPIVLLALNTGLRFGELTGLRWRDVDLVRALLTVTSEHAKTGRARHLPLNTEAINVFRAWRPDNPRADTNVFPGADGDRIVDIKSAWMPLLKPRAANIVGFRFHDLRHTFASKLVMAGVDLNTVRELLGHADIKMTLRYAHLAPEHRAAAVAKLVAQA